MMNAKVRDLLNQQINKEFYSAYLYLDFSNYFEDAGLDGFANWYKVLVLEILIEQHCVIALLLSLNLIPVGKAVKTCILEIVGEIKVKICGVKLLVDLLIQKITYFCIHHNM